MFDAHGAWRALRKELRRQRRDEGRSSFGTGHLLELLDDLEGDHTIDESADRAVLRRFTDYLTDTFFNVLPRTDPPLVERDRDDAPGDGARPGPPDSPQGGNDGAADRRAEARARDTVGAH